MQFSDSDVEFVHRLLEQVRPSDFDDYTYLPLDEARRLHALNGEELFIHGVETLGMTNFQIYSLTTAVLRHMQRGLPQRLSRKTR